MLLFLTTKMAAVTSRANTGLKLPCKLSLLHSQGPLISPCGAGGVLGMRLLYGQQTGVTCFLKKPSSFYKALTHVELCGE